MTPTGQQFTRVLLFSSALLLATGFASANILNAAICQAFVTPQIPSGRSIGDLGVSDFGVGSGTRETRPRASVVQPQFEAGQMRSDGLTPESDGPMVFGPVDGDVPTIGNDRGFGGQAYDSRSNTNIPNMRSTLSNSQDLPTPSNAPPARETSVRRPKADISEMPGREIVRQRYPDGTVQIARHVRLAENGDYVNDGQWKLFDRNGAVIAIGTYSDGEMEGRWARLHSQSSGGIFMNPPFSQFQGPFTSKATFSAGLLSGAWTITDAKGRKVFEMPYKDGKRDGLAVWFYPSEQIYRRMQFSDNVPDGQLVQLDDRGKVTRKEIYQDGKRIVNNVTYYRPTNQKRVETIVHRGRLELEGFDDWWEAKPAQMVVTGEDKQHGPIRSWYQNGQAKMVGNLDDGVRVGRFVWWHENGSKQSMGSYDKAGRKIGQWIWWHDNGVKSIVGQYEDDKPAGKWQWWDRDGQRANDETFDPNAIDDTSPDLKSVNETEADESDDEIDSLFGSAGDPDDADGIDFGADDTDNTDGTGEADDTDDQEQSIQIEIDESDSSTTQTSETSELEDISPEEIEGEELPEPESSSEDEASNSPASKLESLEDRFFKTSF